MEQDPAEAATWYRRASEIRSMDFENVEIRGDGAISRDYAAAYRLLYVYSRTGGWAEINTQPDGTSTTLAQEFRSLAEHMNDEQISEAKRSAREFLKSYVWSWSAGNGA